MTDPVAVTVQVGTGTAELLPDPDLPDTWLLRLNGTAQSYVCLTDPTLLVFDYVRRLVDIIDALQPPGPLDVLHLGGGALSLPRCLATLRPGCRQTVVELDGELAQLVLSKLPLPPDQDITVDIDDARAALERVRPASVDVIVADIFTGARVPPHVKSVEFAELAERALRPGGCFVANVLDSGPLTATRRRAATLQQVFDQVAVVAEASLLRGRGSGGDENLLLVGTGPGLPFKGMIAKASADPYALRVEHGAMLEKFVAGAKPVRDAG